MPAGQQHRPIAGRWCLATLLLALALVAAAALRVTGVFAAATPAVTGVAVPDETGTHPASPLAVARSQAAAWIAAQVSGNSVIACYPDMCAALQAQGVAAWLMPLPTGAASPLGASVLVTSPVGAQPAGRRVRARADRELWFGRGQDRGPRRRARWLAAYQAALRADLASRRSAGSQLLSNGRIQFTAQDAAQLRAGEVDSRLLATLAVLAAQHSFRVTAFGGAAPGAAVLFRQVSITSDGADGIGQPGRGADACARAGPAVPACSRRHRPGGHRSGRAEHRVRGALPVGLIVMAYQIPSRPAVQLTWRGPYSDEAAEKVCRLGVHGCRPRQNCCFCRGHVTRGVRRHHRTTVRGPRGPAGRRSSWIADSSPKAPAMDM